VSNTRPYFWPAVCLLLAVMGAIQVFSALEENQTLDEGTHLVSGYSYFVKHDFRLTPEHPPLAEMLCAVPLLFLHPDFPENREFWERADGFSLGYQFLYQNRIPAHVLLMAGRSVTILLTLLLGLVLAVWTRREFSTEAALFALALYVFDPNLIAHGRYVTTDLAVTLTFFAACLSWHGHLREPSTWRLYRTGILLALALGSKFSALLLIPAFLLMWIARRAKLPSRHAFCALGVVPMLLIWTMFAFDTRSIDEDPLLHGKQTEARIVQSVPVPAYYWFRGIHLLFRFDHSRPATYLLGELKEGGSWLYFPTAFAVKTPVGTLLAILLAGIWGRKTVVKYPVLVIAPAVYFLASMASSINIGIRHILPIYPFLFVFAGAVLFDEERRHWVRPMASVLAATVLAAAAWSYPHYLPFFNVAAGGPERGPRYLLDSNLDWGQDLMRLQRWSESPGRRKPKLIAYFGGADPRYFGFPEETARMMDFAPLDDEKGLVAISAQYLYASKGDRFARLRAMEPVARIGHSIFVYDLGSGAERAGNRAY
jgi:hypothetical protein